MADWARPTLNTVLTPDPTPDDPDAKYLCVDETKRPRANSDPVGLHIHLNPLPEITVTGEDGQDFDSSEELDSYLIPPSPRRRANTCPEDMFLARKGRPPTPPPTDIHAFKSPTGKRFSFNFAARDLNGVSFTHHRLSKVAEDSVDHGVTDKTRGSQTNFRRKSETESALSKVIHG
ncbi:unnamed protein product [Lymnaea stagnalis]|uniref:Uncharacterized protein n=1 Tax=Lymnaea stagnalis TaxID=6523 RepID=A0AAV2I7C8_LYMST